MQCQAGDALALVSSTTSMASYYFRGLSCYLLLASLGKITSGKDSKTRKRDEIIGVISGDCFSMLNIHGNISDVERLIFTQILLTTYLRFGRFLRSLSIK